jgi:long-chain acyl-CoA synthetase
MDTRSLPEIIDSVSLTESRRTAIECDSEKITYGELAESVERWAAEMGSAGVRSGDTLLVRVAGSIDFISVWLALWRCGCIPVPIEPSTNDVELLCVAESARCTICIVSSLDRETESVFAGVHPSSVCPQVMYAKLKSKGYFAGNGDTALYFYTSGTTGLPKCVAFDHAAMRENVMSLSCRIGLSADDVFFTPLAPMLPASIATAVLPSLATGSTLVMTKSPLPGKLLKLLTQKSVSVFFAVPFMYDLLLSAMSVRGAIAWGGVRLCLSSSAFMEEEIWTRFYAETNLPIRSIYCSSEAGAITHNDASDTGRMRNSVGSALPGVKLKIIDGMGRGVKTGETGEIVVGGTHLASGYLNEPDLENEVFIGDWVKTGDIGAIDEDGYLFLSGRISETINVSGHLVNPREVENVISGLEGISDVLVFGKKSEHLGETIVARVVVGEHGPEISIDRILDYCNKHLNHYKIPRQIEFVERLATGRYGKKRRFGITEDE